MGRATQPGACVAVCADAAPAQKTQSSRAANAAAKKEKNLQFSCWKETDAYELVIFDTSSFQELPRLLLISTRGMEDRLKSNRRCSQRTAFLLSFVTSLELAFWTPGCSRRRC